MSSHPEFLIVQGEPFLARTLTELAARCLIRSEVAVKLGQAVARVHNYAFAGVIADATSNSVDTTSFAEQLRADGVTLPIFALATSLTAAGPAQRLFEVEGCTVCVLRAGWPLELQRWILSITGSGPRKVEPSLFSTRSDSRDDVPGAIIRELAGVRR